MARLAAFTIATTGTPVFINAEYVAWVRPDSQSTGPSGRVTGVGIELIDGDKESPFPSFVVTETLEVVLNRLNETYK